MKKVLYIIGIIVALAGILGFFGESILGILDTNAIQNVVFIILGLLIIMSTMKGQTMVTKIIGIIFAILGILGFVLSGDTVLGLVVDSTAVNSFNFIVGVILLVIVFMNKGGSSNSAPMDSGMSNQQMPPQPETPQQSNNPQI